MVPGYDSEIEAYGNVAVLTVSGETDMYTARRFERDVDDAMDVIGGDVVLDLSDLELVDSSALCVLLAAQRRMMGEGRSLVLVVARRHVLRVFTITGLRDAFAIVSSVTEAMTKTAGRCPMTRAA